MNNGHQGALYDQIEANRIHQRGLVLATVWGAFFDASGVLGGLRPPNPPPLCLPLLPFYSNFLPLEWGP